MIGKMKTGFFEKFIRLIKCGEGIANNLKRE